VDADQIVVLQQGKVVEQGQHQQLLAKGGYYAELWALQQRQHTDTDQSSVVSKTS